MLLRKLTIFLVFGMVVGSASEAESLHHHYLHIIVTNHSKQTCQLYSYQANHGYTESHPGSTLEANHSKEFVVQQSYFGTEVFHHYQCGRQTYQFKTRRYLCTYGYHDCRIFGTSYSTQDDVAKQIYNEPGSVWHDTAGKITWVLGK